MVRLMSAQSKAKLWRKLYILQLSVIIVFTADNTILTFVINDNILILL
jgi:hypothetical protein